MNMKLYCACIVLSSMCVANVDAGALKNLFSKKDASEKGVSEKDTSGKAPEVKDEASVEKAGESAPEAAAPEANSAEQAAPEVVAEATEPTADNKKVTGDPVVLRINGKKEYRRSQILADMKMLPPQLVSGVPPEKLFVILRDQKLKTYLMIEQAKKLGLDKRKEYLSQLEKMKDDLLGRMFLMMELGSKVENEASIKARYVKYVAEFKKGNEFKLGHILLKTEAEAKKIVASVAKGDDFAKLAKEYSDAESKDKGGEEGFVGIDMLPPQIRDKFTQLAKSGYTKEPIKTEAGYHVFKILDIRESAPKSADEAKDLMKQMIMQEEMMKLFDRLEKQSNVQKFNEDGTPAAEPAQVPAAH